MFDHVMLMVENKSASQAFYKSLLAVFGHSLIHSTEDYAGFGQPGHVPFWLKQAKSDQASHRVHIAFPAASRALVRRFYEEALQLGAKSNGEPGLRHEHGGNYYAAYVYDLDGHNIEAVCYAKEDA